MATIARRFRHTHRRFSSQATLSSFDKPQSSNKYSWRAPRFIESEGQSQKPQWKRPPPSGKKQKPPYKPPSSLDRSGKTALHSELPFDFQFSYTETPKFVPLGFREPKFSPFGPGRLDREWTGWSAPSKSTAVTSIDGNEEGSEQPSGYIHSKSRYEILGEPLSQEEIQVLVDKNRRQSTKRQVNLGRDGLTHNMLNDIHNYWKRAPAVRIKCMGVPTVDMRNVRYQLEDKTGGKTIYQNYGTIILYRGRNYNPKDRPVIPLMLWKPHEPVYPRLIKTTIDGLTIEETTELRKRGLKTPALTKLRKNGVYCDLVRMVHEAFKQNELVRIDCKGLPISDYKKIGAKLRDLVPCILVTFDHEQIVIWRGKNSRFEKHEEACKTLVPCLDRTNSLMLVEKFPLVPLEYFSSELLP